MNSSPASGARRNPGRGCADGAALPAQSTVQQGFIASLKKTGLGYVHLPDWAACVTRSAIRSTWAGEMLLFEVMRITCRRPNLRADRRIDPIGEPGPDRIDVRRSGAMALSSLAHRGCVAGSGNSHRGHHESDSPPGSYAHPLCQSPRHHHHLPGGEFVATKKEQID